MTKGEEGEKERLVKGMKKNKSDFKKRYGKDADAVMYATATKNAMKDESVNEKEDTLMGVKDPVIVIADQKGKMLDKLKMSVAAKKYNFNMG